MKISELREMLEGFGPDQEVYLAFPSGDHWRTTVAVPVDDVSEARLRPSPYHDGFHGGVAPGRTMEVVSEEDAGVEDVFVERDASPPVVIHAGRLP